MRRAPLAPHESVSDNERQCAELFGLAMSKTRRSTAFAHQAVEVNMYPLGAIMQSKQSVSADAIT